MANIFHIERPVNKITLGTTGTTINIASHTASKILALNASKNLEVVTIGTSLDYTRPTLNTVQDIRTSASPAFTGLILAKASGGGIKVDINTPTFGWRDLKGKITNSKGATKPSEITYREGITQFQFGAGDDAGLEYHIPHDYVLGTDIHLHVHWSHISGAVTGGNVVFTYEITYAKGHNRGAFPQSVTGTITGTASATQYKHIISEGQISISTGSGTQIDTDDLEPDGLILCRIEMTTNNMTGATPDPFIHEVDVHYQSTNLGTKQKAPPFYT